MTDHGVTTTRIDAAVLVITMGRPSVRNAIDAVTAQALAQAFIELDSDTALRVGVLTGRNGDFCTGMDLAAAARGETPMIPGRGFGGLTERPPNKPLIAAVEGYALAGGFEMALACDLIVAARTAQFGLPEVRRGLLASAGGLLRLPTRIPYHAAMRLALTGDRLPAEAAERYGLLAQVTEPGGALPAALTLAATIAANAPLSVQYGKRIIADIVGSASGKPYQQHQALARTVNRSADAREGILAFNEKRAPRWEGR